MHFSGFFFEQIEGSIEQHACEIIFLNIYKFFTVTFDQFNVSLLNKNVLTSHSVQLF